MDTPTVISLTGGFLKFVGELVADLKREELAKIDIDLLDLKRSCLAERLADFKSQLETAVKREKSRVQQDVISRGLGGSTVLNSTLRAVERDASDELDKAAREYNRAIEEIALLERKVKERARPWWKRLGRR
jgi:hypothetical protein